MTQLNQCGLVGEVNYQQRVLTVQFLTLELVLQHGVAQCLADLTASFGLARVSLHRHVSSYQIDE